MLIKQLAEQDGIIAPDIVQANGIKCPADGISRWIGKLRIEGKSKRTIGEYENHARKYLAEDPMPTLLSIEEHLAERHKHLTASSIAMYQKALKSLFKFLYEHNLWANNPVAEMPIMRGPSKEVEPPTDEVIAKLLNVPFRRQRNRQKFLTVLWTIADTGLRMEETVSLRKAHVDFERQELRVMGKGGKERTIPAGPLTLKLLEEFMAKPENNDSVYVFPGKTKSGHWHQVGFNTMLRDACKRAGVPHVNPHALRHYFATRALEDGAKLEIISRILGHADVGITAKVYRHVKSAEYHQEHRDHSPMSNLLPKMLPPGAPAEETVLEGEFTEVK